MKFGIIFLFGLHNLCFGDAPQIMKVRVCNPNVYKPTMTEMKFSEGDSILAVATSEGNAVFLDVKSGKIIHQIRIRPSRLEFSKDDKTCMLVTSQKTLLINLDSWDESTIKMKPDIGLIGIHYRSIDKKIIVTSLSQGGSAEVSGKIKPGDQIIEVAHGRLDEIKRATKVGSSIGRGTLSGPPGTFVRMKLLEPNSFEPKSVLLERYKGDPKAPQTKNVRVSNQPATFNLVRTQNAPFTYFYSVKTGKYFSAVNFESIFPVRKFLRLSSDNRFYVGIGNNHTVDKNSYFVEIIDIAKQKQVSKIGPINLCLPPDNGVTSFRIRDPIGGLEYSADGKSVLVGLFDRIVNYDLETGEVTRVMFLHKKHREQYRSNRSGNSELSLLEQSVVNQDKYGYKINAEWPRQVSSMAMSPSGQLAVVSGTGEINLWDYEQDKFVAKIAEYPKKKIEGLQFSHDGKLLVYFISGELYFVKLTIE